MVGSVVWSMHTRLRGPGLHVSSFRITVGLEMSELEKYESFIFLYMFKLM